MNCSIQSRHHSPLPSVALTLALVAITVLSGPAVLAVAPSAEPNASARFPTLPPGHRHARLLLENALRYVAPQNGMIHSASGYPVEGWNHDPARRLYLRAFTQLTGIGQWIELLSNVVAGNVEVPWLSRQQALAHLAKAVQSLRHDQHDPQLAAKGLLGNFLDLESPNRQGPLASELEKQKLLDAFGAEPAEALWKALAARGWIAPQGNGLVATIRRGDEYGWNHFDGPLMPYADEPTKRKLMALLDQRVVMIVFGDNANLSGCVAKAIGALLHPQALNTPETVAVREELERYLDDQQAGYAHLYDAKAGMFSFGWDATRNRLVGWEDLQGHWHTGHMDYMVNEFRGPLKFVMVRYDKPVAPLANLGFQIKPYTLEDGTTLNVLAPWEGSAFQALGLNLSLLELSQPSWRRFLEAAVSVQLDYARRHHLPGFLSESYTASGTQYTGDVGIPQIAVNPKPRITDAPSLYTLGVAYLIAPDPIEHFLADNWAIISTLLTDHGPWEGYSVSKHAAIQFQTSAHTFALILGLLGKSSENMQRYLQSRGLLDRLAALYPAGNKVDLLAQGTPVYAWADEKSQLKSNLDQHRFDVHSPRLNRLGIAFVPPQPVNLSGGTITLRYRSTHPLDPLKITLKPAQPAPADVQYISKEVFTRLVATADKEAQVQIPLPSTPGLTSIKEVVLTHEKPDQPVELSILAFTVAP